MTAAGFSGIDSENFTLGLGLAADWIKLLRFDKRRDSPGVSGRTERILATGRLVSASRKRACFSGDTCGIIGLVGLVPEASAPLVAGFDS